MAKKLIKLETGKDIISCLPEYIICKILGSLSIGDAIRTSFLSRDWRYKWRKIPDLIFDGQSFSNEQVNPSLIRRNYLRKVNQTLFLHRGNIVRRFEFSSRWEVVSSKVDKWMDHLKLQHLKVENGSLSTSDMFWKNLDDNNSNFDNLKNFMINNVHGSKSELKFIEYIFGMTPLLQVSIIYINWEDIPFGKAKMGDILIQLLSFKKASGANVIIPKPQSD
ncbi:hypothetical protein ZOSMA_73G00100 [Zostera marina]|uniref:F-box domain-containing protein n=1 Tax=Zostera marina TaxID=29655 RepID=A0A0K9NQB1_ZOSMR|nr:hypothetical protein ZOSMA_73G00100 [Zostera marina]